MRIGLGWGRTLFHSLDHLRERAVKNVTIVSLVGGVTHVARVNPAEFAWEFARVYNADCYLIPAPALVDGPATRQALIERCGLQAVYDFARRLDAVVVSVGALTNAIDRRAVRPDRRERTAPTGRIRRRRRDAVQRLRRRMAGSSTIRSTRGRCRSRWNPSPPPRSACSPPAAPAKIEAMRGAAKLLRPTVVVTDEATARTLTGKAREG